jgi:hypothetical protein
MCLLLSRDRRSRGFHARSYRFRLRARHRRLGHGVDQRGVCSTTRIVCIQDREGNLANLGFGRISSSLASLQSSLTALESADTFGAVSASSSAATYATVSADPGAAEGSYSLDVTSLAERQSLVSGDFAATTTQVGTGTLTISLGTPTYNSGTGRHNNLLEFLCGLVQLQLST